MLKNYFSVAFRNLLKHKFYSIINILGLSIGLVCFLLISLYVTDELSYDSFHTGKESIYRLDFTGNINGSEFITALGSAPAAKTMVADYPEVLDAVRLRSTGNWLVKKKGATENINHERVIYADPNFFEFFTFNLIEGDPKTCLDRPNTLVMSQTEATKLFGADNPVGQVVVLDNDQEWEVTGVFEDMPENSHINYTLILTMESREEAKSKFWMSFNFNTYLRLQEGFDPNVLEAKFPALIEKYIGPEVEKFMQVSLDEFVANGNFAGFYLTPLLDIHLYSDKLGELAPPGDIKYIYVFTAIALFILILACINFMNLSTARSAGRAKEVGVRKVMGAIKSQLVGQFLTEAFIITTVSILIAYALALVILPQFNVLASKVLTINQLFSPAFIAIIVGVLVAVGFLAGSYPAFYLSKFKPVEVLKGKLNLGLKSGGLRSVLVVLQFSVSIIMIIGTSIVFQQLSYIQNKKLGFDKDQILMVHDPWVMDTKAESFKNEILQNSNVISGTFSSFLPVNTNSNNNLWFPGTSPNNEESYVFSEFYVDHDYIETLGMEIAEGRNFSKDFLSDSTAILLNEAAVRQLGWIEGVGGTLSTYDGINDSVFVTTHKIIGIVKDFHFNSLRERIEPLVFVLGRSRGFVSFKVKAEDIDKTLDYIASKWDEFAPGQPFQYSFLDERFNDMYENEQKLGEIFGVFAFLAIFIACLGLYGLAAFTAEQKTKEIGVRKVLGASIMSIITLLSKEFLKLVAIAFILASLIGGYIMHTWLQDFEYRTELNALVFLMAGFLALVIAWVTMSFQSWNAARVNPAKSLKDE